MAWHGGSGYIVTVAVAVPLGMSGFHFRGGGVNRAPQNPEGGGAWEKGSIDRHH